VTQRRRHLEKATADGTEPKRTEQALRGPWWAVSGSVSTTCKGIQRGRATRKEVVCGIVGETRAQVKTLTSQFFDRNGATVLVFEVLRRTISKAFCSSSFQGGLPLLLHCAAQVAHFHNCLVIPRKKYSPRWATKALTLRSEAVPLSPSPEAHCRTAARSARSGAAVDHSGPPTPVLGRLRHTKRGRRDGCQRRLRAAHHCPDFWVVDCNNSAREARPACKGGTGAHLAATRTGGDASRLDS